MVGVVYAYITPAAQRNRKLQYQSTKADGLTVHQYLVR